MISFKHLLVVSLLFTGMALNVDTVLAAPKKKQDTATNSPDQTPRLVEEQHNGQTFEQKVNYLVEQETLIRTMFEKNEIERRQLINSSEIFDLSRITYRQKEEAAQAKARRWECIKLVLAGTIIAVGSVWYLCKNWSKLSFFCLINPGR